MVIATNHIVYLRYTIEGNKKNCTPCLSKIFDRHGVHEIKYYFKGIVFKNKTYITMKKTRKLTSTNNTFLIMSNMANPPNKKSIQKVKCIK